MTPNRLAWIMQVKNTAWLAVYYIEAFDSVFNRKPSNMELYRKIGPSYRLPNAFSPNNDGHNDVQTVSVWNLSIRLNLGVQSMG